MSEVSKTTEYAPMQGDVISWNGDNYFVVENNGRSGTVGLLGQSFYLSNFYWNFDGEKIRFVRRATHDELRSFGLLYKIVQDDRVLWHGTKEVCDIVAKGWEHQYGNVGFKVVECD